MQKTLAAMAAAAIVWLCFGSAAPGRATPQASLTLDKTIYFSTESVPGSLTIGNTTATSLAYNPMNVSFLIREDDGKIREQRWITSISMPIPSTLIAPGKSRTFRVPLPVCDVVADPCSEHVALEVSLGKPDRTWLPLVTPERSYSFVADPTATYRADGLSGNRPLVITQADATRSILQRILIVTFQVMASPEARQTTPDEVESIGEVFKKRGLTLGGSGFTNSAGGFTTFVLLRDQDASASVDDAIGDVLLQYKAKVKLLSKRFRPDDFDLFPIQSIAHDGARAEAERLADFVGGGEVTEVDGPELGWPPLLAFARPGQGPQEEFTPVDLSNVAQFGSDSVAAATKGLIDIRATDTAAFAGAKLASGPPAASAGAERTEYVGNGASRIPGLPSRAVIEADRPEIYGTAETTMQAANRLGLLASAVSTSLAAAYARTLAQALGVSGAGPLTLVAAHPEYAYSQQSTIISVGVAISPMGNLDTVWRTMLPSPPPEYMPHFRLVPIATPTPFLTPLTARTPQPNYLTPIDVPDDSTQIVTRGDVPIESSPDRLELSVAVSRRTPDRARALPAASDVELAVRGIPSVANVAVQLTVADGPAGYAVTLEGNDPGSAARVVDRLRRMYLRSDVAIKYDVALASNDCGALITRAQKASLAQALKSAVAQAENFRKPLRHLILAVAAPPSFNSENPCAGAAVNPLETVADSASSVAPDRLIVHAPVELIFRTAAEPR